MTNKKQSTLNARGIVNHFGGCVKLHKSLLSQGVTISLKTIEAWVSRGSIPSSRLVELVDLGRAIRQPLAVDTFIVRPR